MVLGSTDSQKSKGALEALASRVDEEAAANLLFQSANDLAVEVQVVVVFPFMRVVVSPYFKRTPTGNQDRFV